MLILNSEQIHSFVCMPELIEGLREAFKTGCVVPRRQVESVPGGAGDRLFVSMPAFASDGSIVVKLATLFPDNAGAKYPTIQAAIVVFSETGKPTALMDGTAVTLLRTGAASALASTYLSRPDSEHLVIIGTGALAPHMAAAHCAVRPIRRVTVCGRRAESTAATSEAIRAWVGTSVEVCVASATKDAVASADIVSCATSSGTPVVAGDWLKPGTFVDLVGSFSASKREADDDVVRRARIFVDTFDGALAEAGDIVDPLSRGVISRAKIEGELADLTRCIVDGRRNGAEIIVFKSVGTALEDLAAAKLLVSMAVSGPDFRGDR